VSLLHRVEKLEQCARLTGRALAEAIQSARAEYRQTVVLPDNPHVARHVVELERALAAIRAHRPKRPK